MGGRGKRTEGDGRLGGGGRGGGRKRRKTILPFGEKERFFNLFLSSIREMGRSRRMTLASALQLVGAGECRSWKLYALLVGAGWGW